MSEEERKKKVALIRRILDDDKEVRVHTDPWMDNVRQCSRAVCASATCAYGDPEIG
jgi:flagellar protein FliT